MKIFLKGENLNMVKGVMMYKILTRYSIFMAIRAGEQKLRSVARDGKVPIFVGVVAGAIMGYFIAGLLGAGIGSVAGAIVIDSYKK
jgi:uncharacterized protein YcfJ